MSEALDIMPDSQDTRGLLLSIAQALVDHPEAVQIEISQVGEGIVLQLKVDPEDLGKVIGKQGRTARSIRTILAASSLKSRTRFSLDIQSK